MSAAPADASDSRSESMRPLMVLGCTSDAGKSLIATALCRWFARHGVRVAPFKAQNMSNNARVVATSHGSGEIGVAQWLQARAARIEPDVRMNPVLLKPEADTQSQVVVRGVVDRALTSTPWTERHDALWAPMAQSFRELKESFDLIVIEGAGSPAEINLVDQVNNRMIDAADAAGVLLSDIDRGGSFAHLYGTWALVPDSTRRRLAAFVLNRFRGDPTLLEPGPQRLSEMTGMDHLGTLPMLHHNLPREEGATESEPSTHVHAADRPRVVLPRLPFGSNLDEFHLLAHATALTWAATPDPFDHLDPARDLVVLPGSKHVRADMTWLRSRGLDRAIVHAARRGVRIVGVCGGAMMLGAALSDPHHIEGSADAGDTPMLHLLPLHTEMAEPKTVRKVEATFDHPTTRFAPLTGLRIPGYEIRFGQIRPTNQWNRDQRDRDQQGDTATIAGQNANRQVSWAQGNVMATTVHGLFESPDVIERMTGMRVTPVLDPTFDRLADAIDEHMDVDRLWRLTEQH